MFFPTEKLALEAQKKIELEEIKIRSLLDGIIKNERRTNDLTDSAYVYDNQIETAKDIIFNFWTAAAGVTNQTRWNLLLAEMQSGKSGTFFSIPYIISKNKILCKELKIDMFNNDINVFLLTGMNERELIEQFESDITNFTGMKELAKNVLHNSEMRKLLTKPEPDWSKSDKFIINKMRKNSLILIDESHYGSDKNQILNSFLTKILKINPNGDRVELDKNNIYVVSISATPMAEFINSNITDNKKKIVPLKNSSGYFGIVEMFKNNKIKNAYDLKSVGSVDNFLNSIIKIKDNGYILVRCSPKQQLLIEKRISEKSLNLKCERYDQLTKATILDNIGINEFVQEKINHKQIIFLKGYLRAGKRVDTSNIIMTHDTCESNVDTTVQSLLGRCCGYGKNTNIDIYCDKLSAEKYKNWVENGFDLEFVPDKSKNVIKTGKNKYHLERVEILKFDLVNDSKILNKKKKSQEDRKSLILRYINNFTYISDFIVGSFYDLSNKSTKGTYDLKNGYLCIGDMDKEFNNMTNPVNKFVITTAVDLIQNKIEFSIGKIVQQEIISNEKSMYHETNKI